MKNLEMKIEVKRDNLYLAILVAIEVMLLVALVWFATHSEYVSHGEFLAAVGIIITAISGGFWTFWSKLSEMSNEIGYIKGRLNKGNKSKSKDE